MRYEFSKMANNYLLRPNAQSKVSTGLDDPWFDATEEELSLIDEDEPAPPPRRLRIPLTVAGFVVALGLFVTSI